MNLKLPEIWPSVEDQNTPTKSLTVLQDGRLHATWKLDSNWDGDIYLSKCRKMILQDTLYTEAAYFSAKALMGGTGINDHNNVFENTLQVARDATKKKFLAKNPQIQHSSSGDLVHTEVIFYLPYTVQHQLRNFDRGEETAVPIDALASGDWATIVIHEEKTDLKQTRPKIRRRGVQANGGAGSVRPRDEAQQNAHNQAQANRNAARLSARSTADTTMADSQGGAANIIRPLN